MGTDHVVEDQGEWERCRSARRMFLALLDSGKAKDLGLIAEGLLRMVRTNMRGHPIAAEAVDYWRNGLRDQDRPEKEQADRAYLVMRYVGRAFDFYPQRLWPGGGEALVCAAIRHVVPLAPAGFRKVGRLEGNPAVQGESIHIESFRVASQYH